MREQGPQIIISTVDDVMVVELTERKILDEMSISQIGAQLNALINQPIPPRIVIDFEKVAHMSSSALGMLINVHKRVREKKGQLRLCNIQPAIYEVFVITRLNEVFQVSPTRDQAVASIQTGT